MTDAADLYRCSRMEGPRSHAVGAGDTESFTGGKPYIPMKSPTVPRCSVTRPFVPYVDLVDIRAIISRPIHRCVNITEAGASCIRLDPPIRRNSVYPIGGGCEKTSDGVPSTAVHARGVGEQWTKGCVSSRR